MHQNQLHVSEQKAKRHYRQVRNERRCSSRVKNKCARLQTQLEEGENQRKLYEADSYSKDKAIHALTHQLSTTQAALTKSRADLMELQHHASKTRNRLNLRTSRAAGRLKDVVQAPQKFSLKEKGVITHSTRLMTLNLIKDGVPRENLMGVINTVASGLGAEIQDSITECSMARIELEGLVASKLQLVHEIENAKCNFARMTSHII